jgi:hypothetical protein
MVVRFEKMNGLMEMIVYNLRNDKKKIVGRIGICFSFIFFFIGLFKFTIAITYHLIKFSSKFGREITSNDIIYTAVHMINYTLITSGAEIRFIFSYVYINWALNYAFPHISRNKIIKQSRFFRIQKIEKLINLVKTHRKIRIGINSLMGFIPFFNCSLTFLNSIAHFTNYLAKNGKEDENDFPIWHAYLSMVILNIFMVAFLGFFTPTDNDWYLEITQWIIKEDELIRLIYDKRISRIDGHLDCHSDCLVNQEKNMLLNYLSILIASPIQHNAFNMFLIDNKFLLSFMSCLIPFCVMFIQLFPAK